jgi:hypothetical protein
MKLTPISQSQSVSVMASTGPPIPTPALLQTTWTLPKAAKVSSAARTTEAPVRDVAGDRPRVGA